MPTKPEDHNKSGRRHRQNCPRIQLVRLSVDWTSTCFMCDWRNHTWVTWGNNTTYVWITINQKENRRAALLCWGLGQPKAALNKHKCFDVAHCWSRAVSEAGSVLATDWRTASWWCASPKQTLGCLSLCPRGSLMASMCSLFSSFEWCIFCRHFVMNIFLLNKYSGIRIGLKLH